jgi:predicted DNA-binding transcriptional regulator AlpA
MLQIIRKLLVNIIDRIDSGNTNITEEEGLEVIKYLNTFNDKDEGISKYTACQYLNVSRATFDNLVREGKLPEGKHIQGFKEKRWYKKDLDNCIKKYKL